MRTATDPRHRPPATQRAAGVMLTVLTACALLLTACSDADDDADTTAPNDGADTTSPGDGGDVDALVGTWESATDRELTFNEDGTQLVSEGGELLAEGRWDATPTTIELTPAEGSLACDGPATYGWEIDGDTLTLTAVEDSCPGRREGLDGSSRTRSETVFTPAESDGDPVSQGEPGDVTAGETVKTPRLGGLRFVAPRDEFVYQVPGLVALGGDPRVIDITAVVETLDGNPIESIDTVASLIEEASVAFEEVGTAMIAGYEAQAFDFTAEKTGEPRPEDAVFRFEAGGVGGWGPIGEGRAWISDTPRGLMLYSVAIFEPGTADLAEVIADGEAFFNTLKFVEGGQ